VIYKLQSIPDLLWRFFPNCPMISAQVPIAPVRDMAIGDINELLQRYITELEHQYEEAKAGGDIMFDAANRFLVIQPSSY